MGNLIRCALQVCKSKSVAMHFETEVATAADMGADVGDIQHSRKSLPSLLAVVAEEIDHRLNETLNSPLPSTRRARNAQNGTEQIGQGTGLQRES